METKVGLFVISIFGICSIREGALFKRVVYLVNMDLWDGSKVRQVAGRLSTLLLAVLGRSIREGGLFQ